MPSGRCDRSAAGKFRQALTKLQAAIPGWKPRSVRDAIADWVASPMEGAKPLGE